MTKGNFRREGEKFQFEGNLGLLLAAIKDADEKGRLFDNKVKEYSTLLTERGLEELLLNSLINTRVSGVSIVDVLSAVDSKMLVDVLRINNSGEPAQAKRLAQSNFAQGRVSNQLVAPAISKLQSVVDEFSKEYNVVHPEELNFSKSQPQDFSKILSSKFSKK